MYSILNSDNNEGLLCLVLQLTEKKEFSEHITGKEKLFHPEYKEKEVQKRFQKGLENLC